MLLSIATCFSIIGLTSCKSDKKEESTTTETTATTTTTPAAATEQPVATQTTEATTSTTTNVNGSKVTVNSNTPTSVPTSTEGAAAAAPTGPTTGIKFEESTYDYGKVVDGTLVKHTYKFKNTGKEALIISDAKGSCGCTVPQWPKDPIAPGATAEINVQFDSKGKVGPQSKTVTVTANTNPPKTILTIKGEVTAKPK